MVGWVVPNQPDADHIDQSEPDAGDFLGISYHATGVVSGGAITATGPASMNLGVAAAEITINGEPHSMDAASVTIGASGGGQPRFDLIGWTSAGALVIAGTASANPVFPVYDPAVFCPGAVAYIAAGATSIPSTRLLSKQLKLPTGHKRRLASAATEIISLFAKDTSARWRVFADGKMDWGTSDISVLERVSAGLMRLTSAIEFKPLSNAVASLVILRARGGSTPGSGNVMEVRPSDSDGVLFKVDGLGRSWASNFRWGNGPPEGVVTAIRGTLYTDVDQSNTSLALWHKTTTSGNTGWRSFRRHDPSDSALPVGSLLPWLGRPVDTIPTGFLRVTGVAVEIDDDTQALYDLVADRFGAAAPGYFIPAPALGGRSLVGVGGSLFTTVGSTLGAASVTQTIDQMPGHTHGVSDPGHSHPQAGPPWYFREAAYHNDKHPFPSASNKLEHLYVQPPEFDRSAKTGITVLSRGGGEPFSVYHPVTAVTWLVKL